jgi:hypothetical protein
MFEYRPQPKKVTHIRITKTAKQRGSISPSVRKEVEIRSADRCERCGKHKSTVWTLENAHIQRRWKSEVQITANDIVRLCGPSTDSRTCHHWADYTKVGREWLLQFGEKLRRIGA